MKKRKKTSGTAKRGKPEGVYLFRSTDILGSDTADVFTMGLSGRVEEYTTFIESCRKGRCRGRVTSPASKALVNIANILEERISSARSEFAKRNWRKTSLSAYIAARRSFDSHISLLEERQDSVCRLAEISVAAVYPSVLLKDCKTQITAGWELEYVSGPWDKYHEGGSGILSVFMQRMYRLFVNGECLKMHWPLSEIKSGEKRIGVVKDKRIRSLIALLDIIAKEEKEGVPSEVRDGEVGLLRSMPGDEFLGAQWDLREYRMIFKFAALLLARCLREVFPVVREYKKVAIRKGWMVVGCTKKTEGGPAVSEAEKLLSAITKFEEDSKSNPKLWRVG